jgi:hypothetical protein
MEDVSQSLSASGALFTKEARTGGKGVLRMFLQGRQDEEGKV